MSRQKLIHLHGSNTPSKATLVAKDFVNGEIAVKNGTSTDSELYVLGSDNLAVFATKAYLTKYADDAAAAVSSASTSATTQLRTDLTALSGTVGTLSGKVDTNFTTLSGVTDALDGRLETAEGDIQTLKTNLSTVSGKVDTNYTTLNNAITAETEARQNAISAETAARETAINDVITAYTKAVSDEATERDNADKALDNKITALTETVETAVETLEDKIEAAQKAATTVVAEGTDAGNNLSIASATSEDGAVTYTINLTDVASASAFTEVKGQVSTLIGTDVNKSVRTIANEELAATLLSGEADADFKTLQDLAAWLEEHPESAAEMNTAIQANATAITDNANAITAETAARTSADTEIKNSIATLETKLTGATAQEITNVKNDLTALSGTVGTLSGKVDTNFTTLNDAITANTKSISDMDAAYKAKDTEISNAFAAADTKIREDFVSADTKIREDFAAADTVVLTSAKTYTDEQVEAEATSRDNADKALGTRIDGVKETADSAVQTVTVLDQAEGFTAHGIVADRTGADVTLNFNNMVIDCGSWE